MTAMPPGAEARDLSFVEELLPGLTWAVRHYFRAEVTGLDHIPRDRAVLLVANHSGGTPSPDSVVFALSYLEHFGLDQPLYWLGHSLVTSAPLLGSLLRRCGVLPASPDTALGLLRAGGSVVVYPGGEVELHRPWSARNRIRFLGRTGFLRLARRAAVPIVPVVSAGGHNTYLPLSDGHRLAHWLKLDERWNLKVLPVSLAVPWGVNVGDFLLHVPLPARIRVAVLPPIEIGAMFGDDLPAAYEHVVALMQAELDRLAGGADPP
jgi:1-acyl-sn-glycerol-3-phosphate acyltransferase